MDVGVGTTVYDKDLKARGLRKDPKIHVPTAATFAAA